jgi:hypothetical protein
MFLAVYYSKVYWRMGSLVFMFYIYIITDGSYYVDKDTELVFRMWKQLDS